MGAGASVGLAATLPATDWLEAVPEAGPVARLQKQWLFLAMTTFTQPALHPETLGLREAAQTSCGG